MDSLDPSPRLLLERRRETGQPPDYTSQEVESLINPSVVSLHTSQRAPCLPDQVLSILDLKTGPGPQHPGPQDRTRSSASWTARQGQVLSILDLKTGPGPQHPGPQDRTRSSASWTSRQDQVLSILDLKTGPGPQHPGPQDRARSSASWTSRQDQ
ncbi:hypothetical protein NHX12_033241, partial [Muraenolepis orangiensis]